MTDQSQNKKMCPACGAPVDPSYIQGDVYFCPFCGTQSYMNQLKVLAVDMNPEEAGFDATADLAQVLSRFKVGQTGRIRFAGQWGEYTVHGRLVYEYEGGYWNEWYLSIGGKGYWLQEDEGVYIVFFEYEVSKKYMSALKKIYSWTHKAMQAIHAGEDMLMTGRRLPGLKDDMPEAWYTLQFGLANLKGMEGTLPELPTPDMMAIIYVDGVSEDGSYFSLEMDMHGNSGTISRGYPIDYSDIVTNDEERARNAKKGAG